MRHVELDHKAKIAWVKSGDIALASFAFDQWGGANKAQMAAEAYMSDRTEDPWEMKARIEALEQDLKAVLRREEDANRAAMKHLRALEQERIKSKNYADFNHEWRRRCEALEAQVRAADALAELLDLPDQSDGLSGRYHYDWHKVDTALAAYRAAKEGGA